MKRLWVRGCVLVGILCLGSARAQNTLDALDQDLKEAQQQHDDATAQNLTNYFAQVDQAMASPDAAVNLWQQAGGAMPAPTPVTTQYSEETATEKEARLAQDAANAKVLGTVVQVHCGLLHYAALFITKPDQKELQSDFNGWLQSAAQTYPQLGTLPESGGGEHHHHHHHDGDAAPEAPPAPPFDLNEIKGKKLRDSAISNFLGFKAWKDKAQADWSVRSIPDLFKANVLDPSRATPSQATLDAWDLYIQMKQADQPDNDKWTSTDYPPLQFERASDDYAIAPSADKLEVLVQIIHANPTHPSADDWIKRTRTMLDDYRAKHGAPPATSPAQSTPAPTTSTGTGVSVTTQQQGDAQIIITQTNATANPAAPH